MIMRIFWRPAFDGKSFEIEQTIQLIISNGLRLTMQAMYEMAVARDLSLICL